MKVAIAGIRGRFSKILAHEIIKNNILDLSSGLVKRGYDENGMDIGEFLNINHTNTFITDSIDKMFEVSDIVIDFSITSLTLKLAEIASQTGKTLISGTRNLTDDDIEKLKDYSRTCKILYSNNMSITYNLLLAMSKKVAKYLNNNFEINISNINNSLTKNTLDSDDNDIAKNIAEGKGWEFGEVLKTTNDKIASDDLNKKINFATLTNFNDIENYSVNFNSFGEELTIKQKVSNDIAFVNGVLKAVFWISGKENGFYSMQDIFNL